MGCLIWIDGDRIRPFFRRLSHIYYGFTGLKPWINIWANYNDLTATSLGMMVSMWNHPQITLFQVSELLQFTQKYG